MLMEILMPTAIAPGMRLIDGRSLAFRYLESKEGQDLG